MDFSKLNLDDHQKLARLIVREAVSTTFKNRNAFQKFRNKKIKENEGRIFHNLYFIKAYNDLIAEGVIQPNPAFLQLIQKRSVRTLSGVAPVTVMTKPYPCPGKCIYCPTDVRMPKSYLPSQPAAQRAFRQRFDPYSQVYVRLKALQMTGHAISKIELRIIGGTWSAYPRQYQTWFLKKCLQALNEFPVKEKQERQNPQNKLKKNIIRSPYGKEEVNTLIVKPLISKNIFWNVLVAQNESAEVRCIGINIETRPDFITEAEIKRLRKLGVTKVEMGVQTLDEEVHKQTKRGHTIAQVRVATTLLKDAGFKIGYHMMPNLPGSNPQKDKQMVRDLFTKEEFQPDYLKIYPCVVLPRTTLSKLNKNGQYQSYSDEVLQDILADNLENVPEWCRIDRLARDLPADEIESGFKTSNMRQVLETELIKKNKKCREIRFREIKGEKIDPKQIKEMKRSYFASHGTEYFLSYEDRKNDKLIALLRLRAPYQTFISELKNSALIREVHVYGQQIAVGQKKIGQKQHQGWGTKLLEKAEEKAKKLGFNKIAVIAGIGTRAYYAKRGYNLQGTYMIKSLKK